MTLRSKLSQAMGSRASQLGGIFLLGFIYFAFCSMISSFKASSEESFEKFLRGPLMADNTEFLQYIRNEILLAPSGKAYNLLGEENPARKAVEESEKFYKNMTELLFHNTSNGFFVEAGALDGESMSNTLGLEMYSKWSGLLIEADSRGFEAMTGKNRRAWMANVCLSTAPYPQKQLFVTKSQFVPANKFATFGFKMRSMNGLASHLSPKLLSNSLFTSVQCLPLESLLLALKVKRIDLLSLDVEGAEGDILANFPFSKFDVQVIYLEWKNNPTFRDVTELLNSNGFELFRKFVDDSVFVSKKFGAASKF